MDENFFYVENVYIFKYLDIKRFHVYDIAQVLSQVFGDIFLYMIFQIILSHLTHENHQCSIFLRGNTKLVLCCLILMRNLNRCVKTDLLGKSRMNTYQRSNIFCHYPISTVKLQFSVKCVTALSFEIICES